MGPFANNGSLSTRGVGRLPGPLSDQLWRNLKNAQTPAMVLIEGEFPLTWFLTTALLFKKETKVSSVYTWTEDTAEGVYCFNCFQYFAGLLWPTVQVPHSHAHCFLKFKASVIFLQNM